MKKTLLSFLFCVAIVSKTLGQQQQNTDENLQKHSVQMGETVLIIAKKYKITPRDIYDYNPAAVEGLAPNSIIQIPLHRQLQMQVASENSDENKQTEKQEPASVKIEATQSNVMAYVTPVNEVAVDKTPNESGIIEHEVKAGETLFGLSRLYNTTVAAIERENSAKLKSGLQVGQKLTITAKPAPVYDAGFVAHQVAQGETLTGISRKYNTSIDAITQANKSTLKKGLQAGQKLMILPGDGQALAEDAVHYTAATNNKRAESIAEMIVEHKVKTGETLVGLANQYHTTVDNIVKENKSELDEGLRAGQVLKIRENNIKDTVMAGHDD